MLIGFVVSSPLFRELFFFTLRILKICEVEKDSRLRSLLLLLLVFATVFSGSVYVLHRILLGAFEYLKYLRKDVMCGSWCVNTLTLQYYMSL